MTLLSPQRRLRTKRKSAGRALSDGAPVPACAVALPGAADAPDAEPGAAVPEGLRRGEDDPVAYVHRVEEARTLERSLARLFPDAGEGHLTYHRRGRVAQSEPLGPDLQASLPDDEELRALGDVVHLSEVHEDAVLAPIEQTAQGRQRGFERIHDVRHRAFDAVVARAIGAERGGRTARACDAQFGLDLYVALRFAGFQNQEVVGARLPRAVERPGETGGEQGASYDRQLRGRGQHILDVAGKQRLVRGVDPVSRLRLVEQGDFVGALGKSAFVDRPGVPDRVGEQRVVDLDRVEDVLIRFPRVLYEIELAEIPPRISPLLEEVGVEQPARSRVGIDGETPAVLEQRLVEVAAVLEVLSPPEMPFGVGVPGSVLEGRAVHHGVLERDPHYLVVGTQRGRGLEAVDRIAPLAGAFLGEPERIPGHAVLAVARNRGAHDRDRLVVGTGLVHQRGEEKPGLGKVWFELEGGLGVEKRIGRVAAFRREAGRYVLGTRLAPVIAQGLFDESLGFVGPALIGSNDGQREQGPRVLRRQTQAVFEPQPRFRLLPSGEIEKSHAEARIQIVGSGREHRGERSPGSGQIGESYADETFEIGQARIAPEKGCGAAGVGQGLIVLLELVIAFGQTGQGFAVMGIELQHREVAFDGTVPILGEAKILSLGEDAASVAREARAARGGIRARPTLSRGAVRRIGADSVGGARPIGALRGNRRREAERETERSQQADADIETHGIRPFRRAALRRSLPVRARLPPRRRRARAWRS